MGKKILWVEDERFFVQPYIEKFQEEGFFILRANDATAGLIAFEEQQATLSAVILDIAMEPGWRFSSFETRGGHHAGLTLARNIHSLNRTMPVVAFTTLRVSEVEDWFKDKNLPYLLKKHATPNRLLEEVKRRVLPMYKPSIKTFIVHGHDELSLLELKNFLQNSLKLGEPTILREMPSYGRTIIEKFEELASEVVLVFVLLTPDDIGASAGGPRRARPNVIFELGYFYGKMGRTEGKVILLYKGELELPSDISGIVYIDISHGIEASGDRIRRELSEFI